MTAYRNVYRSLNNSRQHSRRTITLHENLHRNVCFEIKLLWNLRFSQRYANSSGLVLKLHIHMLFGCKTQFPTIPLKWQDKISDKFGKDRIDLKFYKLLKTTEKLLKDASSRQTFSTQVVVFITNSYKNELLSPPCLRVYSSHSSDSNQRTAEQIFIEFYIDEFHQHFPAYSKVYAVYPNIWPLAIGIIAT